MNYGYPRTTQQQQQPQYLAPPKVTRPKVRLRVSYNLQADEAQSTSSHPSPHPSSQSQQQRHCFGVNGLAVDEQQGILYSAGRDSTVRSWDISKMPVPEHMQCYAHHTDWINDVFLSDDHRTLVTGSSDAAIKIWDTQTAQCCRTLNRHGDYVKALAYAPKAQQFASAGLDTNIFVWDLQQCTAPVVALPVTSSPSLSCSSGFRNNVAPVVRTGVEKGSLYSLAINATATIVLSGSTERLVRAWDPRSGQKLFKLKGHTDNIKALAVNEEGTLCISGSSDFTLRLWDLRQQQCIHVFETHDDSVWSIAVDPTFSNVYSGGRDGSVFVTDLVTSTSTLVCNENFPILKLLHSRHGGDSLWITTTDSCIKNWALDSNATVQQRRVYSPPPSLSSSPTTSSYQGSKSAPVVSAPRATILGRPGMIKHHIMNNRRHVLTKDSSGAVELWDITQGKKLESFGVVNFENKIEALTEVVSVPNWFSVDTKTGSLTVHLDCPQCFSAEVYAGDVFDDLPEEEEEAQMNLGESVLRALFSYWEEGRRALDSKQKSDYTRLAHPQPNGHLLPDPDKKSSDATVQKEDHSTSNHHDKLSNSTHVNPPSLSASTSNQLPSESSSLTSSTTLNNSATVSKQPNGTGPVEDRGAPRDQKLPLLSLPTGVSVIISEEGTGATMHRATRSQFVGDEPPELIPPWVVDCILHNDIPPTTLRALAVKLGFFLITADESELPALPQGNSRLSAFRLLRIRKVAKYVVQKLELELPLVSEATSPKPDSPTADEKSDNPETSGSSESEGDENGKSEDRILPEQYIDILCNNKVLAPHYSLATVKAFFWKSGDENITLQYKINPQYANTFEGHEKGKQAGKGAKAAKKPSSKRPNLFHRHGDRKT